MYKMMIAIGATVLLAGCSSALSPEQQLAALQMAQYEHASRPMLTLECSNGCQFDKLELRDPRAIADLPALQTPTNGWDFANNVLRTATAVAPWAAVGMIGIEAIDALEGRQNNSVVTTTNTSATTTSGDTAGGDIVGGDVSGDTSGDVRGDTRGDVSGDVRGDTRGDVSNIVPAEE